jgi:L-serine/L-threonine ammonia-lyase
LMVSKLRAAGAYDVVQYGASWKNADTYLREEIMPYVSDRCRLKHHCCE